MYLFEPLIQTVEERDSWLQSLTALQRPGKKSRTAPAIFQKTPLFSRFHPSFPAGNSVQSDANESAATDQRPATSLRRATSLDASSRGMFGFKRGSLVGSSGTSLVCYV
jgi:hypothetical protein